MFKWNKRNTGTSDKWLIFDWFCVAFGMLSVKTGWCLNFMRQATPYPQWFGCYLRGPLAAGNFQTWLACCAMVGRHAMCAPTPGTTCQHRHGCWMVLVEVATGFDGQFQHPSSFNKSIKSHLCLFPSFVFPNLLKCFWRLKSPTMSSCTPSLDF